MTNKEAIVHMEEIRPKKCKMVDGRLQGGFPDHDSDTGKAIDMAIEALEKQRPKWNKTSEVKPTKEKQYLCCSTYTNRPHFTLLSWSNNLYEVEDYDFRNCKGKSGFFGYDSEYGYYECNCDYWQEIEWSDDYD